VNYSKAKYKSESDSKSAEYAPLLEGKGHAGAGVGLLSPTAVTAPLTPSYGTASNGTASTSVSPTVPTYDYEHADEHAVYSNAFGLENNGSSVIRHMHRRSSAPALGRFPSPTPVDENKKLIAKLVKHESAFKATGTDSYSVSAMISLVSLGVGLLTAYTYGIISLHSAQTGGYLKPPSDFFTQVFSWMAIASVPASAALNGYLNYTTTKINLMAFKHAIYAFYKQNLKFRQNLNRFLPELAILGVGVFFSYVNAQALKVTAEFAFKGSTDPLSQPIPDAAKLPPNWWDVFFNAVMVCRTVLIFYSFRARMLKLPAFFNRRLSGMGADVDKFMSGFARYQELAIKQLNELVKKGDYVELNRILKVFHDRQHNSEVFITAYVAEIKKLRDQYVASLKIIPFVPIVAMPWNLTERSVCGANLYNYAMRELNWLQESIIAAMNSLTNVIHEQCEDKWWRIAVLVLAIVLAGLFGATYAFTQQPQTKNSLSDNFGENTSLWLSYIGMFVNFIFFFDWIQRGFKDMCNMLFVQEKALLNFFTVPVFLLVGLTVAPGAQLARDGGANAGNVMQSGFGSAFMNMSAAIGIITIFREGLRNLSKSGLFANNAHLQENIARAKILADPVIKIVEEMGAAIDSNYIYSRQQMGRLAQICKGKEMAIEPIVINLGRSQEKYAAMSALQLPQLVSESIGRYAFFNDPGAKAQVNCEQLVFMRCKLAEDATPVAAEPAV